MHCRCGTKYMVLLSVLVYTLLAAGTVLEHCHTDENMPGHEDHCQGCHVTYFKAAPAKGRQVVRDYFVAVDQILPSTPTVFSLTSDSILHNRAPPADLT